MSRMCEDCGIAPWQDCQCDPRAGMGHPDPRNFTLPERPDAGVPLPYYLGHDGEAIEDPDYDEDRPF